jgi:hypothetical protein
MPIGRGRDREATMEIAPIPGIHALPPLRAAQADMRPPAIFDIDDSAKPGDGGEQRSKRKAAGAEESDEGEFALEAQMEAGSETLEERPAKQVDYFA